jgi:DNA ligase-associated metallophosphoesterase
MSTREIQVRGEILHLLPEGALHWPSQRVLAVADLHLGKAESFHQNGLPLPVQAQLDDLALLGELLTREKTETLIFLGDLVHTQKGLTPDLVEKFRSTVGEFGGKVKLAAGNHDRALVRHWPEAWSAVEVIPEWECGPFVFRHEPPSQWQAPARFFWTGHLHPCVRLGDSIDRMRLKTFVIYDNYGILPAFSRLAGGFDVKRDKHVKLYPLADGKVFEG